MSLIRCCALLSALTLQLNQPILANESVNLGAVRVAFPSTNWTHSAVGQKTPDQRNSKMIRLLQAESASGKLKLHITEYDYPGGVAERQLSNFLEDIKRSYQSSAVGPVLEKNDAISGVPTVLLNAHNRGWVFQQARAMFCADRVYLLEIGGSAEYQQEATQCLDGVSLVEVNPLGKEMFSKLVQLRQQAVPKVVVYNRRAHAGFALISLGILVGLVVLLAIAIHVANILRLRPAQADYWTPPGEGLGEEQ